jgi:hypothetical protein
VRPKVRDRRLKLAAKVRFSFPERVGRERRQDRRALPGGELGALDGGPLKTAAE